MLIRVNKNTSKPVKYAALSSGTISHVWSDDESDSQAPRRQNRIKLTREKADAIKNADNYDA